MKTTRYMAVAAAAALLVGMPAFAANTISVTEGAALNGSNFGLDVAVDASANKAMVISQHPSDEGAISLSFRINPNSLSMGTTTQSRVFFSRAIGNAKGPNAPGGLPTFYESFRVGLRRSGPGYRVIVWYRDWNSVNPAYWEQMPDPIFIGATSEAKITVAWSASSNNGSDGEVRYYKDDVLQGTATGISNELDVDNMAFGFIYGAVSSNANGNFYLDDYVTTRF